MDLEFLQQPTLEELLLKWWYTADACQSGPIVAGELARKIEEWLPREQTYSGSQLRPEDEIEIDGYNQALRLIKQRTRKRRVEVP